MSEIRTIFAADFGTEKVPSVRESESNVSSKIYLIMSNIISIISEQRLGRKQPYGCLDGHGATKALQKLVERTNDLYEIREAEFVRVAFRKTNGIYDNVTISAAHQLSDDEVVALAIREYGVPCVEAVVAVQHVKHQYLVFV